MRSLRTETARVSRGALLTRPSSASGESASGESADGSRWKSACVSDSVETSALNCAARTTLTISSSHPWRRVFAVAWCLDAFVLSIRPACMSAIARNPRPESVVQIAAFGGMNAQAHASWRRVVSERHEEKSSHELSLIHTLGGPGRRECWPATHSPLCEDGPPAIFGHSTCDVGLDHRSIFAAHRAEAAPSSRVPASWRPHARDADLASAGYASRSR